MAETTVLRLPGRLMLLIAGTAVRGAQRKALGLTAGGRISGRGTKARRGATGATWRGPEPRRRTALPRRRTKAAGCSGRGTAGLAEARALRRRVSGWLPGRGCAEAHAAGMCPTLGRTAVRILRGNSASRSGAGGVGDHGAAERIDLGTRSGPAGRGVARGGGRGAGDGRPARGAP
jgi:hypothetical protein